MTYAWEGGEVSEDEVVMSWSQLPRAFRGTGAVRANVNGSTRTVVRAS